MINYNNISIKKNDGSYEHFDAEKINEKVMYACEGLSGVNVSDVVMNTTIKITDKCKSKDIQKALIQSAAELISEETPNYDIVAARLLNQMLRKEVYGQYSPKDFLTCVKDRVKKGYYDKSILDDYTEDEISYYGSKIKYQLDEQATYSSISQMYSKYLLKNKSLTKVIETPQEVFMVMNMYIFAKEQDRKKWILEGYKSLSNKEVSFPTPIMNGLRSNYKTFISCNVLDVGDSTKSLSEANGMILKMTAAKSGIGLNGSHIRGLDADIEGKPVKHTGVLPLFKAFEAATYAMCQQSRGGCHLKNTKVDKLAYFIKDGVRYEATKDLNTLDYTPVYEKTNIEDIKMGDFVRSFNLETEKEEIREVINTFRPIVKKKDQRKITFTDGGYIVNSKKHPLLVRRGIDLSYIETDKLRIGDEVLTNTGDFTLIKDIEKNLDYDEQFYDLEVDYNHNFYAGFNGSYCNHNSSTIYTTWYHYEADLICQLKNTRGTYESRVRHMDQGIILNNYFIEKALNKEDVYLFHMNHARELYPIMGDYNKFKEVYERLCNEVPGKHKKKINAYKLLDMIIFERSFTGRIYLVNADNMYKGPWKEPVYNSNLCCLAGDTRVSVYKKGLIPIKDVKEGDEVFSYNHDLGMNQYRKVVAVKNNGIKKVVILSVNGKQVRVTPDHKIFTDSGYKEVQELKTKDKIRCIDGYHSTWWCSKVKDAEETEVFDIEVEHNHNFYVEHEFLVHNCEIQLPNTPLDGSRGTPEIASCILAGFNHGYIKDERVPVIAEYLVRFLDNMIDYMNYTIPEVEYSTTKRRALGIGHSDMFHYLAKSKKFYNTNDGRELIHKRIENCFYHLLLASNKIAQEKGSCELFNDTKYSDGWLPFDEFENYKESDIKLEQDWETLRELIKKFGLRNSTLSATAPFGNSAKPSNSTSGVEPPRYLATMKDDKNFKLLQLVPEFKTCKNYYTTAWGDDFNNYDYFKMLGIVQKFTDQAISTNQYTNLFKYKDKMIPMKDALGEILTAFNCGLKTLYYQNFLSNDESDGIQESEEKSGCSGGACSV